MLLGRVEAYVAIANPIPHQLRWQASCAFAIAVLAQKAEGYDLSKRWYAYVADCAVEKFSPTLGTKVMDACWRLANMALDPLFKMVFGIEDGPSNQDVIDEVDKVGEKLSAKMDVILANLNALSSQSAQ